MKVKLDKPDCLCNTSQHSLIRVWQQHTTTQSSTSQHNIDKQYCLCIKSIYNCSLIQLVQLSHWSEQTNNSNTKCVYSFIYCILFFVYVHDGFLLKGVEPWLRFVGPTSATNELFIITSHFDKISKVASSFAVSHVAKKTSWQKIFARYSQKKNWWDHIKIMNQQVS